MIWEENIIIWFNWYMSPVYGPYVEYLGLNSSWNRATNRYYI